MLDVAACRRWRAYPVLIQNAVLAMARISKKLVDEMPLPAAGQSRTYLWDDRPAGFDVMATKSGGKSYVVQYIGGRGGSTCGGSAIDPKWTRCQVTGCRGSAS